MGENRTFVGKTSNCWKKITRLSTFSIYRDKAKNKVKTKNLDLFNEFANIAGFGRLTTLSSY